MKVEVLSTPAAVAERAAELIGGLLNEAIAERGHASLGISGGSTPRATLERLAEENVLWSEVIIVQVDERIAPHGSAERNLTMQQDALLTRLSESDKAATVVVMPVNDPDLEAAITGFGAFVNGLGALDVVQLGLGADGHTASLLPGDPVLDIDATGAAAAITGEYQGTRRVTLTQGPLRRARHRVWIVTGADKQAALNLLLNSGTTDTRANPIPAALVASQDDYVLIDSTLTAR